MTQSNDSILKIRKVLVIFVGLICVYSPSLIMAKDTIHWFDVDLPPYHHIELGPWKDKGITDQITKILNENLTGFEIDRDIITVKRLFLMLEENMDGCNPSVKWTKERSEILYFSIPSVFAPSNGIAVRKDDGNFLREKKVSLAQLFKNENLTLGITGIRAFGTTIDPIVNLYKESSRIYVLAGTNTYDRLIQMMLDERIDYVLGYAIELGHVAKKNNVQDKVRFLPLTETAQYTVSCIACNKSAQGKKIIETVNKVLKKIRKTEQYRAIIENWIGKDSLFEYRKAYAKIFINSTLPYLKE